MAISVYMDVQTLNLLEDIKKLDPEFNLSKFVCNAIENHHSKRHEKKANPKAIEHELEMIKLRERKVAEEKALIEQSLIEAKASQLKQEEEEQEQEMKQEKKEQEKFNSYRTTIKNFYPELKEGEIKEVIRKYIESGELLSIPDFMSMSGFKSKYLKE